MQVQVRGKGVEITPALKDYADRKMNRLTNHFSNLLSATVTESIQGREHRVEVQLEGDGIRLRGEERGTDLYAAVDKVVDKLERRMQRHKDKLHARFGHHHHHNHHDTPASPRTAPHDNDVEEEIETGRIVRHKRFGIKPISEMEAVAEMELVGHDFFVFENAQTGQVNVLYRREDKNYGILEPER